MKRLIFTLFVLLITAIQANAVLKEKDLDQTLQILRAELTTYHRELMGGTQLRKQQNQELMTQLMETMKLANQNALMLYSQHQEYVFDLTYACHQATEQYQDFQRRQLPFRSVIDKADDEVAKYDSLVHALKTLPQRILTDQGRTDRNVCLTLAASIRNTLSQNRSQITDYLHYYENTEQRLKTLNDYAQRRYNDIQASIFRNGSENFIVTLKNFRQRWRDMVSVLQKKYVINTEQRPDSQWDTIWILGLFVAIGFYIVVAFILNLIVIRYLLPRRLKTGEFQKKRNFIIMATTTITLAIILGLIHNNSKQNFLIMASNLLVSYTWLLAVIQISLLLRVDSSQQSSATRIYLPLLFVGLLVIVFRIVLVPSELVSLLFPPILLLCTLWQWVSVHRHNHRIPRSDVFYSYISLCVFIVSVVCSWTGYTLFAVQLLIWWIMQLTCILTITCIAQWVKQYSERHGYDRKPITQAWPYRLFLSVVLPVTAVGSVMLSIWWAADVFNLSDLCWRIFNYPFVNIPNLELSIIKLSIIVCLWFLFRYIANTILELLSLHYRQTDPSTAASREVMGRNVVQVIVWGAWLLVSLSLLNVSVTWLLAISGGLSTGIGFASKDIIENIYYGASLMAGRIKVGDWIQVDGTMGKVNSISYTSTVVESLYGEVITFQNAQLFQKNYKNLTKNHGYVLAVVQFGVAYGSNLRQVTQLVEQAVTTLHHKWMDNSRPVKAVVTEMADSSVNFNLYVWADAPKKAYVISDVLKCVYETLAQNGITIPFPQRDIHIIK